MSISDYFHHVLYLGCCKVSASICSKRNPATLYELAGLLYKRLMCSDISETYKSLGINPFYAIYPVLFISLFSPRNVKISTFSNIFLKSYFFVVLLPLIELKRDDDIGNKGTIKLPNTGF